MNENKKNIIINEIIHWKNTRMLPEHYCDFLLALYTEGNQPNEIKEKNRKVPYWKNYYLFLLLIPFTMFLIHFTELPINLQMAFSIIFVLAGIIFTYYFSKKGLFLQIPLITSALILLLTSVEFISRLYPGNLTILYSNLVFNCLVWLLTGWKLKLLSFTISGLLGIVLLVIYILI
ncbi:hypothetical protein KDN24_09470 [Bacillus sp. Bva_UNVM-123]|uniref:hypothetical protein n=1 Tax=Bacillus sp. Bva_UNVM-123 TaxID=2829798 RepID=UPI00391F9793